jgi:hypothetical protein
MALRLVISTDNDGDQMHSLRLYVFIAPARVCPGAPTMTLHVNGPIPISL